ncbi:ABC transporter permease [Mycobacterium antarcticum]|uniref:ABC transporter permease n=1 Tax=Mycolicibacterium sp. TUM20984 TaxID=3023368 RepID=UPI0024E0CE7D|nr:ABC transporter permease [Mycolicibacterium sp. TUM20984]
MSSPVALSAQTSNRRAAWSLATGTIMIAVLVAVALLAPVLTTHNPTDLDMSSTLLPPSPTHWFGTNQYGQDVFARTIFAARIDLLIGVVLVGSAVLIGSTLGTLAAWYGGLIDLLISRTVDIGLAFPFLVLVIAMVGLRGPGLGSLFLAVTLVSWIFYARLVRADVLVAKEQNYVLAAKISGFSTARVLLRHVVPNILGQVVVYATSDFVYAVLLGASVSYLGLGVQPPTAEWGAMVQAGQNFVTSAWWISLFPAMALVYLGIAFAVLGDALAERLRVGQAAL